MHWEGLVLGMPEYKDWADGVKSAEARGAAEERARLRAIEEAERLKERMKGVS